MNFSKSEKYLDFLTLGTASWGQKISKNNAHRILALFYENGYRCVDTATNYPIDKNPENFGMTLNWLTEFRTDFPELKIYVKAGAATNFGDSDTLLNSSYLDLLFHKLSSELGVNLAGIGIHWDNLGQGEARSEVIEFLTNLSRQGLLIGLSGVQSLENYAATNESRTLPWNFQINLSPLIEPTGINQKLRIRDLFPNAKIYGYNLLGGSKSTDKWLASERKAKLSGHFDIAASGTMISLLEAIISRSSTQKIDGILIGPTTIEQTQQWCSAIEKCNHE
jgi:hypothetical protein